METRKAEKRKPIKTNEKTKADKRNIPPITIASSDWLPLFLFSLFRQGVNPAFGQHDTANVLKHFLLINL